jgi:GT2 family glycosyltransferase
MDIGIVVIGRNEGEHLNESLTSTQNTNCLVIYADSASEDNSVEIAKELNVETVELDKNFPLNAARGRNAGAKRLLELNPNIKFIQFIDGDTILAPGWLPIAQALMQEKQDVAIVAGELKEKNHSQSIYKELSALEWQRDPGITLSCGGNLMIRTDVFSKLGGFNPMIIGGEDTELCYRVRQQGWKIFHSAAPMGIHDTKIYGIKDFWKRCARTGYGYQQISSLYAHAHEKLFLRENISNWIYGGIIPIAALGLAFVTSGWSLILFLIYPILIVRIYFSLKNRWGPSLAFAYAVACTIGKFPGFYGACKYLFKKRNK